ncbi:MAG: Gfo/Idh/MocA family oxidoreductase [Bacteroidetes bacterium]|nr:Gfo/Idh/MocA family oxidoreductase [Bacteroidota bacterium]
MSLHVGIIGFGYWGPNLVRNFYNLEGTEVSGVCDLLPEKLTKVGKLYPTIPQFSDPDALINDPNTHAIVIATPVSTHFKLALQALNNGKHVLVEKPLVTSVEEAQQLIKVAQEKQLLLMVDHTFLYNGAMEKIKEIVHDPSFGNMLYVDSTRINLGIFQNDVNVLWDLAAHDISIIHHLIKEQPLSVQAIGASHTKNNIVNIAYLVLRFRSGLIVHISCSWSSPVKIRQMLLGGEHKMIVYNDIEPTDKLKIYDSGFTYLNDDRRNDVLVDYRLGDIYLPKFSAREPLSAMVEDFCSCILSGDEPISSWKSGLEVVRILEMAEQSLQNRGEEIFYA